MKRRGPKAYSLEFREEALRVLESGTKSVGQVAIELGIHLETLRNWRREARAQAEAGRPRTMASVDEENRQLRRENERLREEREILKKATAFFAKDAR